ARRRADAALHAQGADGRRHRRRHFRILPRRAAGGAGVNGPPRIALALGLAAAGAVAIVAALLSVGGPGTARLERLDERRARDLGELAGAVERHRVFTGRLPEALDEVRAGPSGPPPARDPETGAPYDYEVLGEQRFRVCARMSLPEAPPPGPHPLRIPDSSRVAGAVMDAETGRLCRETAEPPG